MFSPDDLIAAGTILKTHGHQGEVKVSFKANIAENLKRNRWFFLEFRKKPVPFFIDDFVVVAPDLAIVKLEDYNSPDLAQELRNMEVFILKKTLPHSIRQKLVSKDLIGFEVYDTLGKYLGKVEDIMESSKQQVLVIVNEGKELLLPNVEHFIKQLDEEKEQIIAEVPDELLDL